ncbi:hypothetical protein C7212DRAFT_355391 [Tuber magnatum]|uniref:Uncharacterized protein n=1 Tax=Tuber magnatum TaxID=42249 RepID=A0A317SY41_9PEZI|nr:hypothetical protein C7212DRAFT_355391 [Tuber magnatum]
MTGVNMGEIGQIEKWAAWNKATRTGEVDGEIIPKPMEDLQELPLQSSLESRYTRLITAHTRTLRNLSLGVNLANAPLDDDTLDLLLLIIDLVLRPASSALAELASLHTLTLTLSLASRLSFLSDSLHMMRQSSMAANQKLQLERVERSRRWIGDGDWDAKCRNRTATNVCSEVTGEFEDVCRGNEGTLRAQVVLA